MSTRKPLSMTSPGPIKFLDFAVDCQSGRQHAESPDGPLMSGAPICGEDGKHTCYLPCLRRTELYYPACRRQGGKCGGPEYHVTIRIKVGALYAVYRVTNTMRRRCWYVYVTVHVGGKSNSWGIVEDAPVRTAQQIKDLGFHEIVVRMVSEPVVAAMTKES